MSTEIAVFRDTTVALNPDDPEFREKAEAGAVVLARVFREKTEAIRRHWDAIKECTEALELLLADPEKSWRSDFKLGLYYAGETYHAWKKDDGLDRIIKKMNVQVWEILIDKLGVKSLMSIKRRDEFDEQLKRGDVPPVTEDSILSVIFGLADQAAEFAVEAARETLKLLTPSNRHYKTNSGFKVGRRVILDYTVERGYSGGRFRANYYREKNLIAVDGTFHVLDGKGPLRGRSPLIAAIEAADEGRGETEYFRFRCFKKGTLHLEFRRLDLVKKLNGLATGEHVLGEDPE